MRGSGSNRDGKRSKASQEAGELRAVVGRVQRLVLVLIASGRWKSVEGSGALEYSRILEPRAPRTTGLFRAKPRDLCVKWTVYS
jgi:hypothetical protein